MIAASTARRIQEKRVYELHMQLCAEIEQAVVNAAINNRTELLVQLHTAMQLAPLAHTSLRLEAYNYDIERLQLYLKDNGYEIANAAYADSFIIKW